MNVILTCLLFVPANLSSNPIFIITSHDKYDRLHLESSRIKLVLCNQQIGIHL